MKLRDVLLTFKKDELLYIARSVEVGGYSRLRKAELVDLLLGYLSSKEIARSRLACLTKEELDLYKRASQSPLVISENDLGKAGLLYSYLFGNFQPGTDSFYIYQELAKMSNQIEDDEFKQEHYKKSWMAKCIRFFVDYYGVAPIELIHKLYSQKIDESLDEMIETIEEMPQDMINSYILTMENTDKKDMILYTEKGLLMHFPLYEDNAELSYWLGVQAGKDFFMPSVKLLDEIILHGYEKSSPAYKKLESFIRKKLGQDHEEAMYWCREIWLNSLEGNMPEDIFEFMEEDGIEFESEKILFEFVDLLTQAHNNTRLKENRGHKPIEIVSREESFEGNMPRIMAGSKEAAKILSEERERLEAMGFPLDIDGLASQVETTYYPKGIEGQLVKKDRKVYPNDTCPCGSGKKYKRCCGR